MAVLTASSSSARQLFVVLRCISFSSKAQVQLSEHGMRFSVDDSRAMQGMAFLGKDMFTSYAFDAEAAKNDDPNIPEEDAVVPEFQISFPSLLETLQIFGASDSKDPLTTRPDDTFPSGINSAAARALTAFDSRTLGMPGLCRFSYQGAGHPLCVHMEEGNVTTRADLVAYDPDPAADIPFDRDSTTLKIVLRAPWLLDTLAELTAIAPERVTITASPSAPYLQFSASGAYGSVTVDYDKSAAPLEQFQVARRVVNVYGFSMLKAAGRAMAAASKVSVRGDAQGVLNMQFLIALGDDEESFVDFRFVPFVEEEGEAE